MLVAAAIDYDIINGNHYGALTGKVCDDIKTKRREAAGLQRSHDERLNAFIPLPGDRTPAAKARRQLEGGTVIIGRHSLKEYMEGLSRGWSGSAKASDQEEEFAATLSDDIFDDPLGPQAAQETRPLSPPTGSLFPPGDLPRSTGSNLFGTIRQVPQAPTFHLSDEPPASIPPQSPIGLVQFTNHLGFLQVPYMVYDFFTERHRTLSGCKAGYAIAMGQIRPMSKQDLDFDQQSEQTIKGSWSKLPERIKESKENYYKDLKKDIKIARELAYGERQPTRAEKSHPPKTEVELRTQRLKKELKWKEDLEGWRVLRGDVRWDERWDGVLTIFEEPIDRVDHS
jgi:import inner membrane translocase subunit TIM54